MSWRDSLWAAAAVASTLKDHAQFNITETLQTAAAKAQQTYEATAAAAASYSHSAQPDSNGHHTQDPSSPAFSSSASAASFSPDSSSPSSTSSSSLSSIASSLTSLPSSLSSFSLPSSFARLTSLTDAATPQSHAALPSVHEEREQLIPSAASRRDASPEPVVLNAEDDLPPLVVNKSSLHSQQAAAVPGRASQASADSEPAPSLYYTPRQHHARNARRELLSSSTPSSSASAGRSSPSAASVAEFEQARQAQVQLFARQDGVMEDMRDSIARLGELGAAIGGEVREQGAMLKEMDDGMDESQGLMAVNRRKLEKILQTAPSSHLRIIAAMVLVVGILLYCILFL